MIRLLGFSLLIVSVAGSCIAAVSTAPEIDASAGVAAMGLLAGGVLILRSRKK